MIKLIVDSVDKYHYVLKDKDNNKYKFDIEFHDLDEDPKVEDVFFVNDNFLKLRNTFLSYGSIDGKYGKKIKSSKDEDLLVLLRDGENIYLKRFYG